ncbi:MAG: hypothetical protein RL885_24805 [Planctomycetota bacterium]
MTPWACGRFDAREIARFRVRARERIDYGGSSDAFVSHLGISPCLWFSVTPPISSVTE